MAVLGPLLRRFRAGEARAAWGLPQLGGPDVLAVSSEHFADGAPMPAEDAGKRIGGQNLSPPLTWTPPPEGTACLLLVVEDLDVPAPRPAVHCLAVLDPGRLAGGHGLPAGTLTRGSGHDGVTLLRSTLGRGYLGPEPIKGHGPHRYVFQLFALGAPLDVGALARVRPRAVLASVRAPVLGRGRLTGIYER